MQEVWPKISVANVVGGYPVMVQVNTQFPILVNAIGSNRVAFGLQVGDSHAWPVVVGDDITQTDTTNEVVGGGEADAHADVAIA